MQSLVADRVPSGGRIADTFGNRQAVDKLIEAHTPGPARDDSSLSEKMTATFAREIFRTKNRYYSPLEGLSDRELEVFQLIGQRQTRCKRDSADELHLRSEDESRCIARAIPVKNCALTTRRPELNLPTLRVGARRKALTLVRVRFFSRNPRVALSSRIIDIRIMCPVPDAIKGDKPTTGSSFSRGREWQSIFLRAACKRRSITGAHPLE